MLVIGLTGSLGSGKSTVAKMFSDLGTVVLNADEEVHRLLEEDKACISAIHKTFGGDVLEKGIINRRKLAGIVFKKASKLKKIEDILHPIVKKILQKKLKELKEKKCRIVVVEVPLLFEAGFQDLCDCVIVVYANQLHRIRRSSKRLKISQKEALRRIKFQWSMQKKVRLADIIIDNNFNVAKTKNQVVEIWEKLWPKIKN